MTNPRRTPRTNIPKEETKHLQCKVLEMRKQGMAFTAIGEELGYNHTYIHKLYTKALKDIIVEDVVDVRKVETAKLDNLEAQVMKVLNAVHPLISNGQVVRDILLDENGNAILNEEGESIYIRLQDLSPILQGVDRAIKIMERRSKLLGLDAPTKTAFTDPDGKETKPVHLTINEFTEVARAIAEEI